jgi:hypothetical protein
MAKKAFESIRCALQEVIDATESYTGAPADEHAFHKHLRAKGMRVHDGIRD